MAGKNSIFRSDAAEKRLMTIYCDRLTEWPGAYEEIDLQTSFGAVHVIASGAAGGRPVVLLHASELSSTSWARNVRAFEGCRIYAIDHIGEVNKSRLRDVRRYPRTPSEITALYLEVADQLEVGQAIVVGASNGGYVAMRFAAAHPERVSRLILSGPMGLTSPPVEMGLRMVAAQLLRSARIEQRALTWILGDSPTVLEPYAEWFTTLMRETFPRVVPPRRIPRTELVGIQAPTLLILGTKDNLVGKPHRAAAAASAIADLRVEILESAHLVNWERSDDVNRRIRAFLQDRSAPAASRTTPAASA